MAVLLDITERGARSPLPAATLRQLAGKTLAVADVDRDLDLSVAFVNRARSTAINRQYRGKDDAADVLSFLLSTGEDAHGDRQHRRTVVGEIILCTPQIRARARSLGTSLAAETRRLFVHGVLHLLGYTHGTDRAHRTMTAAEQAVLTNQR